jgi:hypothetical protein
MEVAIEELQIRHYNIYGDACQMESNYVHFLELARGLLVRTSAIIASLHFSHARSQRILRWCAS